MIGLRLRVGLILIVVWSSLIGVFIWVRRADGWCLVAPHERSITSVDTGQIYRWSPETLQIGVAPFTYSDITLYIDWRYRLQSRGAGNDYINARDALLFSPDGEPLLMSNVEMVTPTLDQRYLLFLWLDWDRQPMLTVTDVEGQVLYTEPTLGSSLFSGDNQHVMSADGRYLTHPASEGLRAFRLPPTDTLPHPLYSLNTSIWSPTLNVFVNFEPIELGETRFEFVSPEIGVLASINIPLPASLPSTYEISVLQILSWSPDGRSVALIKNDTASTGATIRIVSIDGTLHQGESPYKAYGSENDHYPYVVAAWSSDSRAFMAWQATPLFSRSISNRYLLTRYILETRTTTILTDEVIKPEGFSPNGRYAVYHALQNGTLVLRVLDTETQHRMNVFPYEGQLEWINNETYLAWSDSEIRYGRVDGSSIHEWDISGVEHIYPLEGGQRMIYSTAAWSYTPDQDQGVIDLQTGGHQILVENAQVAFINSNSTPYPATIVWETPAGEVNLSWSYDGVDWRQITLVNVGAADRWVEWSGEWQFSPDGSRLSLSPPGRGYRFLIDLENGISVPHPFWRLNWSPDSQYFSQFSVENDTSLILNMFNRDGELLWTNPEWKTDEYYGEARIYWERCADISTKLRPVYWEHHS